MHTQGTCRVGQKVSCMRMSYLLPVLTQQTAKSKVTMHGGWCFVWEVVNLRYRGNPCSPSLMYHILCVCVCVIVCSLPPSLCNVLPTLVKSGRPNHHSWQISLHLAWRIVLILPKLNQPPLRISWAEPCQSCTHNYNDVPAGNSVG